MASSRKATLPALVSADLARPTCGDAGARQPSCSPDVTGVLVKAYSPYEQPPWQEEESTAANTREQLEQLFSSVSPEAAESLGLPLGDAALASAQGSLEAAFSSPGKSGASLAEALALNEFAAHCRVQKTGDVEQRGLARMLGRLVEGSDRGNPIILHAFPWRGETVSISY